MSGSNKPDLHRKPIFTVSIPKNDFNLDCTLCCGQCFRWEKAGGFWQGTVGSHQLTVAQQDDLLLFYDTTPGLYGFWLDYFDLNSDYTPYKALFSTHPVLEKACAFAPGLRLLRQDPWETLCTFILSQNNNIPRIKGLVRRLCEQFGAPSPHGPSSFPSAEKIAALTLSDLEPVRAGFRAKYLLDAAKKVASGGIRLALIHQMDTDSARQELMRINGVGPKVADCTLLFGFYKLNAFPQDIWIKRAVSTLFPDGFPSEMLPLAGIAQQYLFHYVRCHPEIFTQTA